MMGFNLLRLSLVSRRETAPILTSMVRQNDCCASALWCGYSALCLVTILIGARTPCTYEYRLVFGKGILLRVLTQTGSPTIWSHEMGPSWQVAHTARHD